VHRWSDEPQVGEIHVQPGDAGVLDQFGQAGAQLIGVAEVDLTDDPEANLTVPTDGLLEGQLRAFGLVLG
jgi:hypothetical protein